MEVFSNTPHLGHQKIQLRASPSIIEVHEHFTQGGSVSKPVIRVKLSIHKPCKTEDSMSNNAVSIGISLASGRDCGWKARL